MAQRIEVITWEQLQRDIFRLGEKIIESGFKPEVIVAIARGGWVVGRILSDILGVKKVAGITIKFYKAVEKREKEPEIYQSLNIDVKGKRVLLVDDIVDTGKTLSKALQHVKERHAIVKTATPYVKPHTEMWPDYYVRVVDKWVVFPYEYFETLEDLGHDESVRETLNASIGIKDTAKQGD